MKFYHLQTGLLRVNSYFLVDENTNKAILIDCGEYVNKILDTAKKYGFTITHVLLTHAHFDHSGCAKKLQDLGAKIYISKKDAEKILNGGTLSESFHKKFDCFNVDYTFCDGEILEINGIKIKVLETPGHTDGSCTFLVEDKLFTGDTLFYHTYGRIDFPTGSYEDMKNSLEKLLNLEENYKVYPGHDQFTTLSAEREFDLLKELSYD